MEPPLEKELRFILVRRRNVSLGECLVRACVHVCMYLLCFQNSGFPSLDGCIDSVFVV